MINRQNKKLRNDNSIMPRAPRFASGFLVVGKILGNPYSESMICINLSFSGILLGCLAESSHFPVGSILELTLDTDSEIFKEPIQVMGKVAREETGVLITGEQVVKYGLSFSQMASETKDAISKYCLQLEENSTEGNKHTAIHPPEELAKIFKRIIPEHSPKSRPKIKMDLHKMIEKRKKKNS